MGDFVPTVFPGGVTNAAPDSFGTRVPMLWPPQYYTWFDDFDRFDGAATGAHDWMVTTVQAGTGAGSLVVSDALGGVLLITTDDADNDGSMVQWAGMNTISTIAEVAETFVFTPGKRTWFAARFQLSEVTQSDFIVGLALADATPLDVTDGVFFLKADDAATLALVSKIVTPATASTTVATLVAATWYEFAFEYNGNDAITAYTKNSDGTWRSAGSVGVSALPTTELAVTFGYQNGAAGAKTALIDWIFAARER